MDATITFDVEDPITPESDDVVKWQANILSEEDITGTFFLTGEKARKLEERGRFDVIEALKHHDIGFHSDTHSVHPTIAEYLEESDWMDGIETVQRTESPGIETIEQVFGTTPSAFSTTGGSYAPQVVGAMNDFGLAYAYSPISPPDSTVFWFAGTLTFGSHTFGFDSVLAESEPFESRLSDMADLLEETAADGANWIGPFGGHPTRIRATEFWDVINFAEGRNPPKDQWEAPPLRPESEMKTARENFRRLVRFLRDHDLIELQTIRTLKERYGTQINSMSRNELATVAAVATRRERIPIDQVFSPAETIVAYADAVTAATTSGHLPQRVDRVPVGAPLEVPPEASDISVLSWDSMVNAAVQLRDSVNRDSALPATITVNGRTIGLASLYFVLAKAVLAVSKGQIGIDIEVRDRYPYPEFARTIPEQISSLHERWPIHDPTLNSDRIITHSMLQTWTIKPAMTTN